MQVANSAVVLTGASAGIGRATAVLLAQAGADVVITARRADRLDALVAETANLPGQLVPLPGDIRDPNFAHELVQTAVDRFGRLDVLINNAGVGHKSPLAAVPLDHAATIWDTNITAIIATVQAAVPQMTQQGGGQIINVSSIVGRRPLPNSAVYCASKTAVNFLSRSLRMELRPHNILVTLVYPGLTDTEFADAKLGQPGRNRLGARGVSAERVGRKIVAAIANGRSDVYVTPTDWLFVHANRLFPRTFDFFISRFSHLILG